MDNASIEFSWPCGNAQSDSATWISTSTEDAAAASKSVPQEMAAATRKKQCKTPTLEVCSTCQGAEALLKDLEDLAPYAGVRVTAVGCLARCGSGPNCLIDIPAPIPVRRQTHGKKGFAAGGTAQQLPSDLGIDSWMGYGGNHSGNTVVTHVNSFDRCIALLRRALGGADLCVPGAVLTRARLRSDAMRRMDHAFDKDGLADAESLLSQAIDLELDGFAPPSSPLDGESALGLADSLEARATPRLRELRMLRAEVRGSRSISRHEDAILDLNSVIAEEPAYTQAYLDKAKLLRRTRQYFDAVVCFKKALEVGNVQEPPPRGYGLRKHVVEWVQQRIQELEERVVERAAVAEGEFGSADAGDEHVSDSGNGSGRWKVIKITGMSCNTCIYHLTNHPPADPHPCPRDAWHVKVRFGNNIRDYTPISSVADWERGKLDLVVKTYANGVVSRRFALLQTVNSYTPLEEQKCWVMVSSPQSTLPLPILSEIAPDPQATLSHLGIIVGGTGIAPALQLLRAVADSDSAFGADCRATLLYSSKTTEDVLMLNEIRELLRLRPDRISVRHTLTGLGQSQDDGGITRLPGRHFYFTSKWRPFKPKEGPLRIGEAEECVLQGRITADTLSSCLAPPCPRSRIVICGPQEMLDDMGEILEKLGHAKEHIVKLQAFSSQQVGKDAGDNLRTRDATPLGAPSSCEKMQGNTMLDLD